jgi:hypothetical protein
MKQHTFMDRQTRFMFHIQIFSRTLSDELMETRKLELGIPNEIRMHVKDMRYL